MFKSCYHKKLQYFLVTCASSSIFVWINLLQAWGVHVMILLLILSQTFLSFYLSFKKLLEKENICFISLQIIWMSRKNVFWSGIYIYAYCKNPVSCLKRKRFFSPSTLYWDGKGSSWSQSTCTSKFMAWSLTSCILNVQTLYEVSGFCGKGGRLCLSSSQFLWNS